MHIGAGSWSFRGVEAVVKGLEKPALLNTVGLSSVPDMASLPSVPGIAKDSSQSAISIWVF